jgi:hypothetical protein
LKGKETAKKIGEREAGIETDRQTKSTYQNEEKESKRVI